ncbi:MAG: hypothetical protein ACE5HU_09820 [Acidobacteriota bacterium]
MNSSAHDSRNGSLPSSIGSAPGPEDGAAIPWRTSLAFRVFSGVVIIFLCVLAIFVLLDVRHEMSTATYLGASPAQIAIIRRETILLHLVHGILTAAVLGIGVFILTRRLITSRISGIVLAVHHFQLGTWKPMLAPGAGDEIDWLSRVFCELGPYLERTFTSFLEADRKALVANLGVQYAERLIPPGRRILTLSREMICRDRDTWAWQEVERSASTFLAQVDLLGRPEHPAMSQIVTWRREGASSPGPSSGNPQTGVVPS